MSFYEVERVYTRWFENDSTYKLVNTTLSYFYKISELMIQVNPSQEKSARSILKNQFATSYSDLLAVFEKDLFNFDIRFKNNFINSMFYFQENFTEKIDNDLFHNIKDEFSLFLRSLFYLTTPCKEHLFFQIAFSEKVTSRFKATSAECILPAGLLANGFTRQYASSIHGSESYANFLNLNTESMDTYNKIELGVSNCGLDVKRLPPIWFDFCEVFFIRKYATCNDTRFVHLLEEYDMLKPTWEGSAYSLLKTCDSFSQVDELAITV